MTLTANLGAFSVLPSDRNVKCTGYTPYLLFHLCISDFEALRSVRL